MLRCAQRDRHLAVLGMTMFNFFPRRSNTAFRANSPEVRLIGVIGIAESRPAMLRLTEFLGPVGFRRFAEEHGDEFVVRRLGFPRGRRDGRYVCGLLRPPHSLSATSPSSIHPNSALVTR